MRRKRGLGIVLSLGVMMCASCVPSRNRIYTIGDTVDLEAGYIRLIGANYQWIDENACDLKLTYKIYSETERKLDNTKLAVVCGSNNWDTDRNRNAKDNGTDIFEAVILNEITYAFHFVVPRSPYFDDLENRAEGYLGWRIKCYIEEALFEVYTGSMHDEN